MPMEIMPIIEKMAVLVLLMLIGFCCAKLGLTNAAFNQKVTPVVMNVLLVATILNSVVSAETVAGGVVLLEYFAAFAAMFFISFLVAWGFARLLRRDRDDESVLRLTMMFPNNAFVGFPVVAAVFGEQAVFYAAISNIPFNILLYTLGTAQLRRTGTGRIAWKQIFTAPLIATLAAAALYLTHLPVPHVIGETISVLGAATIPMSMIIVGTSLGGIPARKAFGSLRVYAAAAVRLLVLPIAVWAILRLVITDTVMLGIPVLIAACPSAMIITVLCITHGRDESLSSEIIFTSTVLCAVTMPFLAWLLF